MIDFAMPVPPRFQSLTVVETDDALEWARD